MVRPPIALALAAALVSSAADSASTAPPVPAPAAATQPALAVPPSSDRKVSRRVCRDVVHTGTRMGSRRCKTRENWEADARETRRFLEEEQRNFSTRDGGGNEENMRTAPPR